MLNSPNRIPIRTEPEQPRETVLRATPTSPSRNKRFRRPGLVLAATALLLCAGAFLFRDAIFPEQTSSTITAPVIRGNVEEAVLASGTFKPIKLVAVGAQVSGRITALNVKLGDKVQKDTLIAQIDSTTQSNDLKTAQASLANVKAQRQESEADLENAQLTLTRQQTIFRSQAGSKADLDTATASVKKITAQIAALDAQIIAAEVAVETARANLSYTRITAPMDGTVLAIVNQQGQTVNAAQSAPTIVILGELDTMIVRTEISEADVVKVKVGQPVYFTILGDPATRYDAVLQSIEPAPESITSDSSVTSSSTTTSSSSSSSTSSSSSSAIYYNGVFAVPNQDNHFRTYMSAEVHIVLGAAKDALTIPSSALGAKTADGSYGVLVVGADGKQIARTVIIGLNNNVTAEVLSGLSEGDRVVIGEASATVTKSSVGGGPPPMGF
ncbi:efflux RND transporter periplasmic adaptor subunit [Rhizobium rhizogenes]|uniref:efflux RND transporter periplasmic adaptor subunit n=1 Tax=Rhizobium rhizogenes TaxID=359 RepID=UPI001572CCCB|nr:efflux RND transporter periplasmic adaptor subunit [Rhizobium rhizogenes]NTG89867.1 efflux RND transporter periplasmic adaptor subunit [Rhizobium rhizogenes]QRM41302.1 efflux RND transporter periplasmic adaptor subunit [Rhizobium rhizogenes]